MLEGRTIVVGMGGGIAAYKAVALVRELLRRGAQVRVAMTQSATRFVGPMTLTGLTGHPAILDLWDPAYRGEVHVELGAWADAVVIAPATMNVLARAANGMADDAVLATIACARGEVLYAPAMHTRMWESAATQRNVRALREAGAHFAGPAVGPLASGEVGAGRMEEPEAIADALATLFTRRDLEGQRILVSAGPTHEDLDPVRFLGNRSTGRMGFALAAAAASRGARVTLVSGPTELPTPNGVRRVDVRSALQMQAAITSEEVDAVIMAAAVADYRPEDVSAQKRKKQPGPLSITLVRNPDILAELGAKRIGGRPVLVGFALETEELVAHARGKLERKKLDLVVANLASEAFGGEANSATLVGPTSEEALPTMSKRALSDRILDRVLALLESSR